MNAPKDVRDALIAEAIGDAGKLLLKIETLTPTVLEAFQALQQGRDEVIAVMGGLDKRMEGLAANFQTVAAKHLARKLEEAARSAAERHTQALQEAGLSFFRGDFGQALARLEAPIQQLAGELAKRRSEFWMRVLWHAVTASVTLSVTLLSAPWWWPR